MMSDAQFRTGPINAYLNSFLQEHTAALKNILAAYVLRAGLAIGSNLLNLMVLHECNAAIVGHYLGITPEAVRVRLHRALRRLRIAWSDHKSRKQRGEKRHG